MNHLQKSLADITRRVTTGSQATQANRREGLHAIAGELWQLGYRVPHAKGFKTAHVDALVGHWKETGIKDATIRNRLGWLRWWAEQVNKQSVMPADNTRFGLAERTPYQGNRARRADADALAGVADQRIRLALRMERAFGMRREEILKFEPKLGDRGSYLALKASTTKGGRYREIPITHPAQRELLDELRAVVGDGALIPPGSNYVEYLQRYKHLTRAAGLGNAHGLRHGYAQWRYERLTGWKAPASGGPTREQMTPAQAARDRAARLEISRELGHGRIDIADTYLGRVNTTAAKAAA